MRKGQQYDAFKSRTRAGKLLGTELVVLPERQLTEAVTLADGAPLTELRIAATGHYVVEREQLLDMMKPEHHRIEAVGNPAIQAMRWTTRFMGFHPDDWPKLAWRHLCIFPVVMEAKACFQRAVDEGLLQDDVANNYLGQLKMLSKMSKSLKHISRDDYLEVDDIPGIPVTVKDRPPALVSVEDFQRAIQLCSVDGTQEYKRLSEAAASRTGHTRHSKGSRERGVMSAAMLYCLRAGFARSIEIRRMTFASVLWNTGEILLIGKGHGGKKVERRVAVPDVAMEYLACWRAIRGDAPGPLFYRFAHHGYKWEIGKDGKPLGATYASMQNMCSRIGGILGIADFRTHAIGRMSGISWALDKPDMLNVVDIRQQSGHRSDGMVQRYDQRKTAKWGRVWDNPDNVAELFGSTGPEDEASPAPRACAVCGDPLGNMRADATVCRKPACRQAHQRRKRAESYVAVTEPPPS